MSERADVLTLIAEWQRSAAPMPMVDILRIAADEIARLREERRWVPVGERLPAGQSDDVLTARGPWEDGGYSIGIGWWNGECWMSYNSDRDTPSVAFWQPLPPGPEGDG